MVNKLKKAPCGSVSLLLAKRFQGLGAPRGRAPLTLSLAKARGELRFERLDLQQRSAFYRVNTLRFTPSHPHYYLPKCSELCAECDSERCGV